MRIKNFLLLAALWAVAVLPASAYQNPARGVQGIGDPSVLRHEGVYYMYATTGVELIGTNIGIACWSSTDMVRWKPESWANLISSGTWVQMGIETPDVQYIDGKFLMFYSGKHTTSKQIRICVAESDSPLGPFREIKTPLFEDTTLIFDPYVFRDDDGRNYLYYTTARTNGYNSLNVYQLTPDLRSVVGKPFQDVLARPFSPWEIYNGYPIAEGAHILKRNGLYYLLYSGNHYVSPDYAVGYATSTSPLGPFTRYAGNPILKKSLPAVSGPGSGHVTLSPDGTEMFYLYNAHLDPAKAGGNRTLYIDRLNFTPEGTIQISGPTNTCQPDPSSGGPGSIPPTTCPEAYTAIPTVPITPATGWIPFHSNQEGFAWSGTDPLTSSVVLHVTQDPYLNRRTAVVTHPDASLPYSDVGTENYVRARFAVYRANQKNPNDLKQTPIVRMRAATRFAYANVLEVYHHLASDPAAEPVLQELIPSADPERPSVYTVDFDPIDVPLLENEKVMRTFEAYSLEPQENGDLVLAENSIGVYPKALLPDSDTPDVLKKVYAPGLNDAGDLRSHFAADTQRLVQVVPIFEGYHQLPDNTDTPPPLVLEAGLNSVNPPPGVTLDTQHIPYTRLGIAAREFFPGADPTASDYIRVEPGKQYKIRWHLTSTAPAATNGFIRLRTRSLRFGWNTKIEIGGSYAASHSNNALARQILPGVGCLNPDKMGSENGGWYTQLVHTPLDPDIRGDFADGTSLENRMPLMSSEPGPGENANSLRDLKFGFDMLDTLDAGEGFELEVGNVTLDRIEVRVYPRIPD